MANTSKFAAISKVIRNKKGKGNVIASSQLISNELKPLADEIKAFMMAQLDAKSKGNKIRKDKSGLYEKTKVNFNADGIKLDLPEYAQYLETGRRKGAKRVPIAAIIKWIKRYRVISRNKKTGRFTKSSASSINNAAFAIQQAIYKNGIKARPFIQATLDYAEQMISQVIDEILIPEIISVVDFHFNRKP